MDVHKSKRSRGNIKGKNISWQKVCNYKHTYLSSINTVMHNYFQSRPTIEGFVIFKFLPFRKNVPNKTKMYAMICFFFKIYKRQRCYILWMLFLKIHYLIRKRAIHFFSSLGWLSWPPTYLLFEHHQP